MRSRKDVGPGERHARRLLAALAAFAHDPAFDNPGRRIISGVDGRGACVGEMTLGRAVAEVCRVLVDSRRIYRHAGAIVYETAGDGRGLVELASRRHALPGASSFLSNLFGVAVEGGQGRREYLPPAALVSAAFTDDALWRRLPEVAHFSNRPAFDRDFSLCRPGWNEASGILVHGPEIIPVVPEPAAGPAAAIDRLPPRLRELLGEFGWASEADLVGAVAALLTGLLINHFIDDPHPVVVVDANQPQVGKTLLVQAIGRVLDGVEPPRIPLAGDEELEKKLGAHLLSSRSSLIFLDNVRDTIASSVLELNALAPLVSIRILGRSATVERPNGYLWFVTANGAVATSDTASRSLTIRLRHDGDPSARSFSGDPLGHATRHRLEILGELAGMVLRWLQVGGPRAAAAHRCSAWSSVLGGILGANGLGGFFLAAAAEARADMDQGLLDLAALAAHAWARRDGGFVLRPDEDAAAAGRPAAEWADLFSGAGLAARQPRESNERARSTFAGRFLAGKVDRSATIDLPDGELTLTLRRRDERSKKRFYYFAVTPPAAASGPPVSGGTGSPIAATGSAEPQGPNGPTGSDPSPGRASPPELSWL